MFTLELVSYATLFKVGAGGRGPVVMNGSHVVDHAPGLLAADWFPTLACSAPYTSRRRSERAAILILELKTGEMTLVIRHDELMATVAFVVCWRCARHSGVPIEWRDSTNGGYES